jgi:hypothetical protein
MNKALIASMEAIDFQRDSKLIAELALQLDSALSDPSNATFNAVSAAMKKIAKKHTGMTFNFHFIRQGGPNAFVIPPQANAANPMRSDQIVECVTRLKRPVSEQELFKGEVNIKTGKVSGAYSDIPVDIFCAIEFFTWPSLRDVIKGEHIAAILTHEMGHAFTYLRYLGKMALGNVVVSEILRRQHEGEDDKVVQEVVRVAEQKTGWRIRDLGEINRSSDPLVIQQIVLASVVESIRSELGTKFYDRRAFEFSSDQFVARHGGAHLIVQALDLMYKAYPAYLAEYRGRTANYIASMGHWLTHLGAGLFPAAYMIAAFGPGAVIPALIIGGFFSVVMVLFSGGDDGAYDPIEHRYKAMRREVIASSKDQNLTVQQRRGLIEQIQAIDEIVDNLTHKHYFGPAVFSAWLTGIFNGRPAEQKFQRQLEELVNNRLFELSNKLQTV